jgi:hypothetical protein
VCREYPVGNFIEYLWLSGPFAENSRGYDRQLLLRRVLELKWVPQLVMDGVKILSMCVENLHFLDSVNDLPISLKSMPKSFDLTCKKGYYPHFLKHDQEFGLRELLSRNQVL